MRRATLGIPPPTGCPPRSFLETKPDSIISFLRFLSEQERWIAHSGTLYITSLIPPRAAPSGWDPRLDSVLVLAAGD